VLARLKRRMRGTRDALRGTVIHKTRAAQSTERLFLVCYMKLVRSIIFSGYPFCSSEGHSKKTFHHRDTEQFKKRSGLLCALCVSSERNERVVKRIINPDNSYWSEVDNQIRVIAVAIGRKGVEI